MLLTTDLTHQLDQIIDLLSQLKFGLSIGFGLIVGLLIVVVSRIGRHE